jgi:type VI secretion system protein ImpH
VADANGQTTAALIQRLSEKPYAFDFYAALRLLQAAYPEYPRIGYSWSRSQDPVRFGQAPALDFAPATLESVQCKSPARPPVVYCRHFGVFGPNGPLPLCLTEYARDRILHHGDPTFAAFCNIFHDRLLSFFFRAWADARKTVDFDRPKDQHWAQYVGSLAGLGLEGLLNRDTVPDRAKLYFSGRLVPHSRNAEGLEAITQEFFGLPTRLLTFVGRWLKLPPGTVCKLGSSPETGTLGATVIVGARFWTCQLHFRMRMGPMKLHDYERMLPGTPSFKRLKDWVRQYSGEHFSWDLQLVLAKEEVPEISLGRAGRLGWTTWLKTRPFERDADNLVLEGSPSG